MHMPIRCRQTGASEADTASVARRIPNVKPARSARQEAGGGQVSQPPQVASIRDGSAAQPLAGSRGAAPSPTCCLQHNSRSVVRFSATGAA